MWANNSSLLGGKRFVKGEFLVFLSMFFSKRHKTERFTYSKSIFMNNEKSTSTGHFDRSTCMI